MKRWIKRGLFGLFGAGLVVGGLSACSHGGFGQHGRGPMSDEQVAQFRERATERVGRELKLDDAQKAKFAKLTEVLGAQRKALSAGTAGGTDLRAEAQSLLSGSTFDRTKAQALVNAKTAAVNEQSPAVIAAAADFFDSLNAEQQQKVRDFLARRGHHGWRG